MAILYVIVYIFIYFVHSGKINLEYCVLWLYICGNKYNRMKYNFMSPGSFDKGAQQELQYIHDLIAGLSSQSGGGSVINPGNAVGDTTVWDGTEWQPTDNVAVFVDDHIEHTFTDGVGTYRYYGGKNFTDYAIISNIVDKYLDEVTCNTTINRHLELLYDDAAVVRINKTESYDIGSGAVQAFLQMNNELSALVYADTVTSVTGSPSVSRIVDFYEGSGLGQQTVSMATDGVSNTYSHLMYDILGLFISQSHLYSVDATNSYFYDYLYDSTGAVLQFSRNVGVDQVTGYVSDMYNIVDNTANTRISESRYFDGTLSSIIIKQLYDNAGNVSYTHQQRVSLSGSSEDYINASTVNRQILNRTTLWNVNTKTGTSYEYGVSKALVDAAVTGDALVTVSDSNDNGVNVVTGNNYLLQFLISGVNLTTGNFQSFSIEMCSIFIKWEAGGGAPTLTPLNTNNANTSDLGALPLPDVGVIVTGNNIEIQANCGLGNATDIYRYTVVAKLINLTNV